VKFGQLVFKTLGLQEADTSKHVDRQPENIMPLTHLLVGRGIKRVSIIWQLVISAGV